MKIISILIVLLMCLMVTAPAFALESNYKHIGYYDTFKLAAVEQQKADSRVITSRDGQQAVIVPLASEEQNVEQQKLKVEEEKDISK